MTEQQAELKPKDKHEELAELVSAGALMETQINEACEQLHESILSQFSILVMLNPVWGLKLAKNLHDNVEKSANEVTEMQGKFERKVYDNALEQLRKDFLIKE